MATTHDDVIKWKHFPCYWPFVWGIHRSPVNSPHKVQWRGALMFSMICVWINGWVNNREAGDLRHYRTHYDVIVMIAGSLYHQGISSCSIALVFPSCSGLSTSGEEYNWRMLHSEKMMAIDIGHKSNLFGKKTEPLKNSAISHVYFTMKTWYDTPTVYLWWQFLWLYLQMS